jgi:hypothetical protein
MTPIEAIREEVRKTTLKSALEIFESAQTDEVRQMAWRLMMECLKPKGAH